jgi:hypothetical protein
MDVFGLDLGGWFEVFVILIFVFGIAVASINVFTEMELNFDLIAVMFSIFLVFLTYMEVLQPMYSAIGIIIMGLLIVSVKRGGRNG